MPALAHKQSGLSMVELLVAMALSVTVMSGVVSVVVASKTSFITERELATLQENARYAVKYLGNEIKMAGFNGCGRDPLYSGNSINGSVGNWYLDNTGIQGFEHEAGTNTYPAEFSADVLAGTDAFVVRYAEQDGLSVSGNHNPNSANLPLNKIHDAMPGDILVVSAPDCQQVGIFQVSGPTNNNNNASHVVHNTGSMVPGNCTKNLTGNFNCDNYNANSTSGSYGPGSRVMRLRSQAFYLGTSSVGNGIPALYREDMKLDVSTETIYTEAEELVQGIENMQLLYGVDNNGNDRVADIYLKANDAAMDWRNVVSVRLFLRMRSLYPVYNSDEDYGTFRGIAGTDGSDRFMRQVVSTTVQLRN